MLASLLPVCAVAQRANNSPYVVTGDSGTIHLHPTPEMSREIKAHSQNSFATTGTSSTTPALSYNGGPVMTGVYIYAIFWTPPTLQTGAATSLTSKYEGLVKQFAVDYAGHGVANNSTQYYSISGTSKVYVSAFGGLSGAYVDTNPYPASGCTDSVTPGNCISDSQLQGEISRVMALENWTPAINKIFVVFTGTGEGSCTDGTSSSCAYTQYCAYHSAYFGSSTSPILYANMPYADPNHCYAGGNGQHSPNGDIPSDAIVNLASHEITEAVTDPELNAWWDTANGAEIGDLCAWQFGTADWDNGLANQMWKGHYYDLQLEYDNHTGSCVKVGP